MSNQAKGKAEAFDASALIVDGDPDESRRRAAGAVEGFRTQLAEAHEAAERAELKVDKAKAELEAAKAGVEQHAAEIPSIEKHLAAAQAHLDSLTEKEA
jgi:hypothetical protein